MTLESAPPTSTLWLRLLAALVLIPVTLAFTFIGHWPLAAWLAIAGVAMSVEWVQIVHNERIGWRLGIP